MLIRMKWNMCDTWGEIYSPASQAGLQLYFTNQRSGCQLTCTVVTTVLLCVGLKECTSPIKSLCPLVRAGTLCFGARGILANLLFSFSSPSSRRICGSLKFRMIDNFNTIEYWVIQIEYKWLIKISNNLKKEQIFLSRICCTPSVCMTLSKPSEFEHNAY